MRSSRHAFAPSPRAFSALTQASTQLGQGTMSGQTARRRWSSQWSVTHPARPLRSGSFPTVWNKITRQSHYLTWKCTRQLVLEHDLATKSSDLQSVLRVETSLTKWQSMGTNFALTTRSLNSSVRKRFHSESKADTHTDNCLDAEIAVICFFETRSLQLDSRLNRVTSMLMSSKKKMRFPDACS